MRNIFVSYCHEDADFAQILDGKIREAGFATWRDVNLSAGEEWRLEIDDGIKGALAVVVVMSPRARISPYVNYEWAFAIGSGVPVLPILLKLSADELHPRLGVIQYLDFGNDLSQPWDRLAEALRVIDSAQREFTLRVPRDAPPVVRDAARALDSMDSSQRRAGIDSLAQMTHPAAIQLLADALLHPIQEVRFGAAFHLGGNLRDVRALPALLEAMRCNHDKFQPWMISNIGEPAVPALIEALKEMPAEQRDQVRSILGYIGGPLALQTLVEYLHDPDPNVRRSAADGLADTKDSAAVPALRETMRDPDARVRAAVAPALGRCGGAAAVPDLLELLHDEERDVRHAGAYSLVKICELKPVPAALEAVVSPLIDGLIRALDDEYDQVRFNGRNALKELHDARAIPGLIAALRHEDTTHLREISDLLTDWGEAALPALREVVHDPNEALRIAAAGAIAQFASGEDATRVAEMLRDESIDVRLRAISRISNKLGQSSLVLEALFERLRDPEEDVCTEAMNALAQIGHPSAVPHLIECLQNEDLASAAAGALNLFGTREARAAVKVWEKSKK